MNSPEIYGDGLRARARQEGRQHPLGRLGRRPDPRHARRRQDVDERHAEGHAGLRPRQHHRRVGVRSRRRLRRGQEAAARRLRALHLPHARLRQDVDEDRRPASRQRLRARGARRSDAQGPALRRHAARLLHLVRRRRPLAVAVAEPARRAGVGRLGRGQLDRDRDARPQLLHPRRHRAAAAGGHGSGRRGLLPLQAAPTRSAAAGAATIPYLLRKPRREADDRDPRLRRARSCRRSQGAVPGRAAAARGARRCRRCGGRAGRALPVPSTGAQHRRLERAAPADGGSRRCRKPAAVADADAAVRRRRRWRPASIARTGTSTTPAR